MGDDSTRKMLRFHVALRPLLGCYSRRDPKTFIEVVAKGGVAEPENTSLPTFKHRYPRSCPRSSLGIRLPVNTLRRIGGKKATIVILVPEDCFFITMIELFVGFTNRSN